MARIIIASRNPAKIDAAASGFKKMFPTAAFEIIPVSVDSGVSDQPFSDRETFQGAFNRMQAAKNAVREGDFWVGIEGGSDYFGSELTAYAWIVISDGRRIGKGKTGSFMLPPAISELIHQGMELGEADDVFFNRKNSKQGNGAIGILTGDVINRMRLYEQAVVMALIPFKHPELYPEDVPNN